MGFVLDTADIPPADRIDVVYEAMMAASVPSHVIHENPAEPIRTRLEVWDLGGANVFTARSSGLRLLRTPKQARQDAAPVVALSVQLHADGRRTQFDMRQTVPPGSLMLMDLSAPYDFAWSGEGAAGCLQIPFAQIGLPVEVIRRAAPRLRTSPLYDLVCGHVRGLVRDAPRLSTDPTVGAVGRASIDLARALLASAAQTHEAAALEETLVSRIRAHIQQNFADPALRPATVAAAHNISLRHLYKVCAEAGFSLEQSIIAERLEVARAELSRPSRTIAQIALRCGFTDPTHFARRFRARYGMTPSEWRRLGEAPSRASSEG